MGLSRYVEALQSLQHAKLLSPKEACVSFQLGRVCEALGRGREAVRHYNEAMDLNTDSKDFHTIRAAIERLDAADEAAAAFAAVGGAGVIPAMGAGGMIPGVVAGAELAGALAGVGMVGVAGGGLPGGMVPVVPTTPANNHGAAAGRGGWGT